MPRRSFRVALAAAALACLAPISTLPALGQCASPFIGGLGGHATKVEMRDGYAFVAKQHEGFAAYDVRDPAHPRLASVVTMDHGPVDFVLRTKTAYVMTGEEEMLIVDIRDPEHLRIAREFEFYAAGAAAHSLDVSGDLLAMALSTRIEFYDVSTPLEPWGLESIYFDQPQFVTKVQFDGDRLYGAGSSSRLFVIDVLFPSAPWLLNENVYWLPVKDFIVEDGIAYILQTAGLDIVDVTDASGYGQFLGRVPLYQASALDKQGDMIVLAGSMESVFVVDVSDPENPELITTTTDRMQQARDIAWNGDTAAVADSIAGLRIFDLSDPSAPVFRSLMNDLSGARAVATDEDAGVVHVVDADHGVWSVRLDDPAHPEILGSVVTPGGPFRSDIWAELSGGLLYVLYPEAGEDAEVGHSGVRIFDVADPSEAELIATIGPFEEALQMTVGDGALFVLDEAAGVLAYDVSDPRNPVLASALELGETATATVFVRSGSFMYVAGLYGHLRSKIFIIDVRDLSSMSIVNEVITDFRTPSWIGVRDSLLVEIDGGGRRWHIFDLSDPAAPVLRESDDFAPMSPLRYVDGILWCATEEDGFRGHDLRCPYHRDMIGPPTLLRKGGRKMGFDHLGDLLVVAADEGGLQAYDISTCIAVDPCPADVTGTSGAVDEDDLQVILGTWGPCSGTSCRQDLNCDNLVDVNDVFALLSMWGSCPE